MTEREHILERLAALEGEVAALRRRLEGAQSRDESGDQSGDAERGQRREMLADAREQVARTRERVIDAHAGAEDLAQQAHASDDLRRDGGPPVGGADSS